MKLDEIDRSLLRLLQRNARLTHAELADKVAISSSSCQRRVKSLEQAGIIKDYVARVDAERLGFSRSIYVQITLKTQHNDTLKEFERAVTAIPEVMECCLMAGSIDYLLRLRIRGMEDYERLHLTVLTRLPGVERVQTQFVVRDVFRRNALPI